MVCSFQRGERSWQTKKHCWRKPKCFTKNLKLGEKMWQQLKTYILGPPIIVVEHEFFGKILFMGGEQPADDDYWEAEYSIGGTRSPITVLINAPQTGPDERHELFFEQAVTDLDLLFQKCWPIFEPDFEQWTGKTFSGDWHDDFKLMSIEIPSKGDELNEWSVSYEVAAASHFFTARFIDGNPQYNEIDG